MEEKISVYVQSNAPLYDPTNNEKRFCGDLEILVDSQRGDHHQATQRVYWIWDSGCHEVLHPVRADLDEPLNCHPPPAVYKEKLSRRHIELMFYDALTLKSANVKPREFSHLGKNYALVDAICTHLGVN